MKPSGRWLTPPPPEARATVFCFPYAGGGASAFRGLQALAPPWLHVAALRYPGREERLAEPPFVAMEALVDALVPAVLTARLPFCFFGHSLGALVAYELAERLRAMDAPLPAALFVSAAAAPHRPRRHRAVHRLPDAELVEMLRLLDGTPPAVLADAELMALVLPTVRADMTIFGTYAPPLRPPLPLPIHAFGGTRDRTIEGDALEAWRQHTSLGFELTMVPGNHFFIHDSAPLVLERLSDAVAGALAVPATAQRRDHARAG